MAWRDIPLDADLLLNVADASLRRDHSAVENCYRNDVNGVTRFPGLKKTFNTSTGRNYLFAFRGDMLAVTGPGQIWKIGRDGSQEDVTGVILGGPYRPVAATTDDDQIIFAKGAKLTKFAGNKSELLAEIGPPDGATHVVYFKGYVIANEPDSGRFFITQPGQYALWNPLDVFNAESRSDDLTAITVSPRNELLLGGNASIERWDTLASGTQPLYLAGSSPEGLIAPYTLSATRDGNFGVNQDSEFVQFMDQATIDVSKRVQQGLDSVDDWSDAWTAKIVFSGSNWYLLQAPNATNDYGTKGITLIYDFGRKKWSQLYDWNAAIGLPTRWPGWSYLKIWGRHFVGGEGCIYEMLPGWRKNGDVVQRMRLLTAHYDEVGGQVEVHGSRLRLRRGLIDVNAPRPPILSFRVNRDNQGFTGLIEKSLGAAGQNHQLVEFGALGAADTFQFEFLVTDDVPVDMVKFEIDRIVLQI